MKCKSIEIEIEKDDHKFEITVFYDETVLDIKNTIMELYGYEKIIMFNTYVGDFHLNDYYDNFRIDQLINYFIVEKFRVKDIKSNISFLLGLQLNQICKEIEQNSIKQLTSVKREITILHETS